MRIPNYLTRYYQCGENPFLSLNDLPLHEANRIKRIHCHRNQIGDFYSQDDYLIHRKEIETWIYQRLLEKGGKPKEKVPVYMTLGDSPTGEYDIRGDIQRNACEIKIPLFALDLSAVTFTWPDSMYRFTYDPNGKIIGGERTNTPDVYTYQEVIEIIKRYDVYENYSNYIEAQVWNREMLHSFIMSFTSHKVD